MSDHTRVNHDSHLVLIHTIYRQGRCVHIGELGNCLEQHFGKSGEMWTNRANNVGRFAKIFQPATDSLLTDNCWCICAGMYQHVWWVVITERLITYSCFIPYWTSILSPLLSTQGRRRFLSEKYGYKMLRISFFASFGLLYRLNLLSTLQCQCQTCPVR